jgi:molecular chaperone GrpE
MEDMTQENQEQPEEEQVVSLSVSEHKKLVDDLAQTKDKYLRVCAEFENARKRMDREKIEFLKYANKGLILEFLNILDDLERSFQAARAQHQDYTAFLKGIEMVMAHVYELLKRHGVQSIEAQGKLFDPHCHEVLLQEESDSLEDNTVIEELQKGYMLEDRVVRTSKVKVSKKKEN